MRFEVFHRNQPHFRDNRISDFSKFPSEFTKVAVVETDHIGQVFQLTNHIELPWNFNEEVTALVAHPRSTSVGDIIVDETGRRFSINGIGLEEF